MVETAHRITLRNAKAEAVTVDVVENIPGDWRMLEESQPHSKRSTGQAVWNVTVPAGGEAELTYRVRALFGQVALSASKNRFGTLCPDRCYRHR